MPKDDSGKHTAAIGIDVNLRLNVEDMAAECTTTLFCNTPRYRGEGRQNVRGWGSLQPVFYGVVGAVAGPVPSSCVKSIRFAQRWANMEQHINWI